MSENQEITNNAQKSNKKDSVRVAFHIDKKTENRMNIILMNEDSHLSQKELLAKLFTDFINEKFSKIKDTL